MKARDNIWILIIGIIISIISFGSLFYGWGLWYFPAVIGVWFIFDYFSSKKNKNTAIQLFNNNKKEFFNLYLLMFFLGCAIELLGKFILNFWSYPYQTNLILDLLGLAVYPFILISFREMYESLNLIIKNKIILIISSMLLGIIIWEIPNLLLYSWIYKIPYVNLEIFKINIVVIIGWIILIAFPVWIYNRFFQKERIK